MHYSGADLGGAHAPPFFQKNTIHLCLALEAPKSLYHCHDPSFEKYWIATAFVMPNIALSFIILPVACCFLSDHIGDRSILFDLPINVTPGKSLLMRVNFHFFLRFIPFCRPFLFVEGSFRSENSGGGNRYKLATVEF